jgi:hypothetical protein
LPPSARRGSAITTAGSLLRRRSVVGRGIRGLVVDGRDRVDAIEADGKRGTPLPFELGGIATGAIGTLSALGYVAYRYARSDDYGRWSE